MKKMHQHCLFCSLWVLGCILLASKAFGLDGAVFDLQKDWSTNSNPNGAWTYRAGSEILPPFTWYAGLQAAQFSWENPYAPTSSSSLPAWFRSVSDPVDGLDWLAGDVVVHSQDDLNGAGNGQANVVWTSPFTGIIQISGGVWMGRDIGRSDNWVLSLNGNTLSTGSIYSGDPYSRAKPFEFDLGSSGSNVLHSIKVSAGDQIMLEIDRTSTYGDFVGVKFTISQIIPQPILSIDCSQVGICWDTVTNAWYQLQYTSTVNTNWIPLYTNFIQGTGFPYCTNDTIVSGQPQRFYRAWVTNGPPSQ